MTFSLGTILAHPDDETFGTGGTLIRYASEGVAVHSLCLTEGEKGWAGGDGSPVIAREHVGAARALELAEAGRRMGLASVTCLKYPDGDLASVNEDYVVRDIVRWLRKVRPDVVITWGPDGGYGHPDHIAAGERALRAIELAGIARYEPELGDHVHVKRCYRFVAQAELVDNLTRLMPQFGVHDHARGEAAALDARPPRSRARCPRPHGQEMGRDAGTSHAVTGPEDVAARARVGARGAS
jgi:LmbE family N-acetylglucosaminyl deacetylase